VTAIVFIVALAGAGGWLWWRGRRGTPISGLRPDRRLAIAETRSLGNRQYLVVAAYDGRKFLLSVCPGRIELLAPLDPGAPPAP
jgi:flagellar protein FliO/FliZ